jgi:hypothetical protein
LIASLRANLAAPRFVIAQRSEPGNKSVWQIASLRANPIAPINQRTAQ